MQPESSAIALEDKQARARKRRKQKREDPYPDIVLARCYFTETPLEILANILQHVYPIDLLSLSCTNNYLRKTLRDEQQRHIWKLARQQFPHTNIPDPVRLTEIELAALLFGTGPCSICDTGRDIRLESLVKPMRVCKRPKCRTEFERLWAFPPLGVATLVYGVLPYEKVHLGPSWTGPWNLKMSHCKNSDIAPVLADIATGLGQAELESKYKTTFGQTRLYSEFLKKARLSLNHLLSVRKSKESETQRFTRHKLAKLKFSSARLENSITYTNERRRLNRSYQALDEKVWDSVIPRAATDNPSKPRQTVGECIVQEMQAMEDAAERRQSEANMRKTKEATEQHWHQLKNVSGQAGSIIPRLNEFNALPVVNALLKPKASDGEIKDLYAKDSTLSKLVKSDVITWEERTCAQFRKILQIPIPKKNQTPELGVVPPLDRVTSLFECARCKSVDLGLAQEGTLTFRSAVKHRCKHAVSKKFQWKPDLFQPDIIGIQIARLAVVSSGLSETKANRRDMNNLGPCFLCTKCPSPIYLTFGNLIGHMKRHGVSDPNETFVYQTSPPDVDLKPLSSSEGMVEARRRGTKKGYNSASDSQDFFMCRHCDKSLLWNGLVSHVKAKHNFFDIRDEDFYPKPKSTSKPKPAVNDTDSID